ncbi:MAG: hypothetical protein IKH25_10845, partial [Muribaculaceae bacterium]|nr:hypothetical protein [Muribaculaceae bacterium]
SISATSRPPRGTEQHGVEYFFLSPEEFRQRRDNGEFLEWCEVYEGRFYGTLKTEVDHMLALGLGSRHSLVDLLQRIDLLVIHLLQLSLLPLLGPGHHGNDYRHDGNKKSFAHLSVL